MRCASGDNPAQVIEAPAEAPVRRIRALTAEQVQELLGVLPDPCRTMVQMAVTMSMNVSEMLGLCERHLNLTGQPVILEGPDVLPPHEVAIREQLYHSRRGTVKTGSRCRNVPIPQSVEAALRSLLSRNVKRGPDAPVFQTRVGTAHSADNLAKRVLKPKAASVGIEVNWHALRHTHATLSKIASMSDADRQAVLGHASAEMTAHYTHTGKRAGIERIAEMVTAKTQLRRIK
jgi:site-specific recombinase XerC